MKLYATSYTEEKQTFLNKIVANHIKKHFPPTKMNAIVDVGSGNGTLGREISRIEKGYTLIAVDKEYPERARKFGYSMAIKIDITKEKLPKGDIAAFISVLNYLTKNEVKIVAEKFKENGYQAIYVHDYNINRVRDFIEKFSSEEFELLYFDAKKTRWRKGRSEEIGKYVIKLDNKMARRYRLKWENLEPIAKNKKVYMGVLVMLRRKWLHF